MKRGGQVFFVHNRIKDIEYMANMILELVPDAKVTVGHGQMEGAQLEKIMVKFIEGEYDVLVSTNIIESGLDVPNANTIIINRAHMYGLSDLHQMRGRVGRSNRKAYCHLLAPPMATLSSISRKRLQTLEQFTELGDGFKIAMRDLDIRGAGNLLGGEQSGFITDIGFETYHKLLDETIQELKETEFKDLFHKPSADLASLVPDCVIETDLPILIPESYVANISERLRLYNELDDIKNQKALDEYKASLVDRFGVMPHEVEDLIETVKLRWLAQELGFEKVSIKKEMMRCSVNIEGNEDYFQSETFGRVLAYVQQNAKNTSFKEIKGKMIVKCEAIESVGKAIDVLASF